mgnify:CR=1 FL=1
MTNPIYLRVRTYADTLLCHAWLIQRGEGGTLGGFLHGVCHVDQAVELAELLGIELVREDHPMANPELEVKAKRQADLFPA